MWLSVTYFIGDFQNTLCIHNCFPFLHTEYPTFTNYSHYSANFHCYLYPLPPVYHGDPVEMTVSVSGDDVSLMWYTDGDHITCDTHDQPYHCTNDNKVSDYKKVALCIPYNRLFYPRCKFSRMVNLSFSRNFPSIEIHIPNN